jgi:PIN domain nuclease of toxin-antitoxin system
VLIDTRIFLWLESGSPKLPGEFRQRIVRFDQRIFVSAASFREIAVKRRTGRLVLGGSPRAAAKAAGFAELPIDADDAFRSRRDIGIVWAGSAGVGRAG